MSRRIEDLQPIAQVAALKMIGLLKSRGVDYVITSTLRTLKEQQEIYARGCSKCDGIKFKSNHQSGYAIDIVPPDKNGQPSWPWANDPRWLAIAECGKEAGFIWGGDWKDFPDYPHYEILAK